MKSTLRFASLALGLIAVLPIATAQTAAPSAPVQVDIQEQIRVNRALRAATDRVADESFPTFDLDFPGGTPADLIKAINKASGQTLNAIIAPEYATRKLPPIHVQGVDAAQLFAALGNVQRGSTRINGNEYHNRATFLTDGQPSSRSIWYFSVGPEAPELRPITRFFPLAYYLQRGLTVDDITTAIRTSWEMHGEAQTPAIKFHQETQLLIAVGQPEQLTVIGDVLEALTVTVRVRAEAAEPAAHGASAH